MSRDAGGTPGHGRTVLCVLHGEEVGGASLSILRALPRLEELGWRPVVWAPRPSELYDEVRSRGLDVHGEPRALNGYSLKALRLPPGMLARAHRAPRYFGELRRLIRRVRPALAHCNSMYTLAEAALARRQGVPVVMHVHEMVGASRKQRLARRLIAAVGDEVVGVSTAGAQALSSPDAEARVVFEACEVPVDVPGRDSRPPTTVGSIGVIAPRKGTDTFVAAAELVRAETEEVEFELIGSPTDPLEQDWARPVLARAAAAGVRHRPRADVESALAGWDLFALPSRRDPFPIVVLEAMASCLPVVGTAVDGIAEQITPETGVLVEPGDSEALAQAILALHRDPSRRSRLGTGARERVIESFSLARQAEALSATYLDALGEG